MTMRGDEEEKSVPEGGHETLGRHKMALKQAFNGAFKAHGTFEPGPKTLRERFQETVRDTVGGASIQTIVHLL